MQNWSTDTCVKESKDTNTTHCYVIHTLPVLSLSLSLFFVLFCFVGPGVAQWLRHCATSRAVPGSNPGGIGHWDFSRGY